MDTFRPGQCRLYLYQKYGLRGLRVGGRSSAGETAVRVAAGALAKKERSVSRTWLYEANWVKLEIPFETWDVVNDKRFYPIKCMFN